MDRMSDSGSDDWGSNPHRGTNRYKELNKNNLNGKVMKFRIAKKIMTGRSSYNRRCEQLRPLQMLDDGNVFVPAWNDIDRIRRAAKVYFHHLNRNFFDGNMAAGKI